MRDQRDRQVGDHADRFEILFRIEAGLRIERRIDRDRAGVPEQQRVAVRRRGLDRAGAERAAGAAAIVDHELLLERRAELVGDDTRHRIDAAAGREWHDDGNGPGRIIRRNGRSRQHAQCEDEPTPTPHHKPPENFGPL